MEEGLGAGFWLKLTGVVFAIGVGGLILMLIFTKAIYAWGFLGAFIAFAVVLLLIAWVHDRRAVKKYEEE